MTNSVLEWILYAWEMVSENGHRTWIILVKRLWLCLWELWHPFINTKQWSVTTPTNIEFFDYDCLWELWHSFINTKQRSVTTPTNIEFFDSMFVGVVALLYQHQTMECHNSHKHSPLTRHILDGATASTILGWDTILSFHLNE